MFNRRSPEQEWTRHNRSTSAEREEALADEVLPSQSVAAPTIVAAPILAPATGIVRTPPASDSQPRLTRSMHSDGQDVETLIGEHTTFEGTLRCEGSVRIMGAMNGEVESKATLMVDERARVVAKVTAAQVTVAGFLEGEVHCTGKVEIRQTGRVQGELHAGSLIVHEGAIFDGSSRMDQGSQADREPGSSTARTREAIIVPN